MSDDLTLLYRKVGIPETTITKTTRQRTRAAAAPDASSPAAAEPPLLTPELLEQLERQLETSPNETLARARRAWTPDLTLQQLRQAVRAARRAMSSPNTAAENLDAAARHFSAASRSLPPDFFPGIDPAIAIDPEDRMFENDDLGGILGWVFGAGALFLTQQIRTDEEDFLRHNAPAFPSGFVYPLEFPAGGAPLDIALFSDFGVGRYYSRYIAKQLRANEYPYAIHLGDVYFAGRDEEFENFIDPLLNPILSRSKLFMLNSNHEMFSGGKPYFKYIKRRRDLAPLVQQQEGSYFCLRSDRFQIIGIDTAFFGQGRMKDRRQLDWLRDRLQEGRRQGRINILLSADHPYRYGSKKLTKLLKDDLAEFVIQDKLVDLWFWGNTHYCALFHGTETAPFIGSCIGHGGYPYDTMKRGEDEPAPMAFLEERARFPKSTDVRQDKGNNGYCSMKLHPDGTIDLKYIDWMSETRCEARLQKESGGAPLKITSVNFTA